MPRQPKQILLTKKVLVVCLKAHKEEILEDYHRLLHNEHSSSQLKILLQQMRSVQKRAFYHLKLENSVFISILFISILSANIPVDFHFIHGFQCICVFDP